MSKGKGISQESINYAYRAVGDFMEAFSTRARNEIQKKEDSGDMEQFRAAQEIKGNVNLLDAHLLTMKKKYPHLFDKPIDEMLPSGDAEKALDRSKDSIDQ